MQLIYRGHLYPYTPASTTPRQPRALNWRYQGSSQIYESCLLPASSRPFRVNWRYQAVEA